MVLRFFFYQWLEFLIGGERGIRTLDTLLTYTLLTGFILKWNG